jgi:site-specific recombinase XerD
LALNGKISYVNNPPSELAELLPSWLLSLRAQQRSPKTIQTYGEGVRAFLLWCDQTGTQPELTRRTVTRFTADILDRGASPNTACARHQALKRFSAWLASEGEIDEDHLVGLLQPKVADKVTDPLTATDLQAMFKACHGKGFANRRDEAMLRLMAETGMRAGECMALTVTDIDLTRGVATIQRGKGGQGRIVPFGASTAAALDRYLRTRRSHPLAAAPQLWLGDRSKTFGYTGMYRALGNRAKQAGVLRFHPHLLRHTAATRWLSAGGTEGGLMAVAGWKRREMLDRYVAATAAERAAVEARGLNLGEL